MSAHRIGLFHAFICLVTSSLFSQTSVVQVVENSPKNWELHVDGEPYYIKGAGGENKLKNVIEAGGNTIRTWGTENAQSVLDNAHELGIKVMLGLWVQHERHGFEVVFPHLGYLDRRPLMVLSCCRHSLLVGMVHDLSQVFRVYRVHNIEEVLSRWAFAFSKI